MKKKIEREWKVTGEPVKNRRDNLVILPSFSYVIFEVCNWEIEV